ncbi:Ku protein [Georgenia wangjunii]|uniref:non-homologous end joining protein Ku n=1 Tax=Georgenia wangjunii TaxID=3117730 RepID=UPI002F269892
MRAIWTGAITFGLVNVPIKLYSATESHDVRLHQVHNADGGRIRYQRRCEVCDQVVQWDDIDKAYDDGEQTVVLTDADLESLPVEKNREIDVMEFVPSEQIDPIMMDKSYFVGPDSKSTKSYQLLRRTLEETDRTAVVTFTLRQKTRLGALRVRGDVLVLQSLLWDDEVREASFPELDQDVRLGAKELEMSSALVDSFSADFDPSEFTDDYQEELTKLIEAKLEKGQALDTEETFGARDDDEGGEVLDLMEALRRSVEQSKKKRSGAKAEPASDDEGTTTKASGTSKAPARKPAAKSASKPAASKAAASKASTTAKKDTAKEPAKPAAKKRAPAKPREKKTA